jgi:hypothetical protein
MNPSRIEEYSLGESRLSGVDMSRNSDVPDPSKVLGHDHSNDASGLLLFGKRSA